MGQSTSKHGEMHEFNPLDWDPETQPSSRELGSYSILRNRNTGVLLDKYHLELPSNEDYNFYIESLKWRRNQPSIVRVYHYDTFNRRQFCSSTYAVTVYLYHVKGRLSEFKDIPYPDNLYCMMAMLDGYKKLYEKIGKFYLSEEQVCIDEEGQIRVWLNSDLSKNFPQVQPYEQGNFVDEEGEMVAEILEMVINNTDQSEQPPLKFIDFYQQEKEKLNGEVLGFQDAKSLVNDYARYHNQEIPDVFESVLEIYRNQQNEDLESDPDFLAQQLNQTPMHIPIPNSQPDLHQEPLSHENPHLMSMPVESKYPPPNSIAQGQPMNHTQHIINQNQNQPMMYSPPPVHNYPQPNPVNIQVRGPPPPSMTTSPMTTMSIPMRPPPTLPNNNPMYMQPQQLQFSPMRQPIGPIITYPPPGSLHPPPPYQGSVHPTPQFLSPQPKIISRAENIHHRHLSQNQLYDRELQAQSSKMEEGMRVQYDDNGPEEDHQDYEVVHRKQQEDPMFEGFDDRKVTQSQACQLQASQHSGEKSLVVKYSAPSSQIHTYPAKDKRSNISNMSSLSNPPRKSRLQYYYTVEEEQELDPEISADLLLYT